MAILIGLGGLSIAILGLLDVPYDARLDALEPQLVTHRTAPDFSLRDQQGRELRLSELRGHPVVLNFWSRDCPPCVSELPNLERLSQQGRSRGSFRVVTVSVDESWPDVSQLFDGETRMTVLFDPERQVVTNLYGTEMFPETYLIDREGYIRARFDGAREWDSREFVELLEHL